MDYTKLKKSFGILIEKNSLTEKKSALFDVFSTFIDEAETIDNENKAHYKKAHELNNEMDHQATDLKKSIDETKSRIRKKLILFS